MTDKLDRLDALDRLDRLDRLDAPRKKGKQAQPVAPVGTLEGDCLEEMDGLLSGFRSRAQAEQARFELATDSEYWTCLCFQSRAQAEAFAAAVSWLPEGEKYVDGVEVARILGIALPDTAVPYNTSSKKDRKLISLT